MLSGIDMMQDTEHTKMNGTEQLNGRIYLN